MGSEQKNMKKEKTFWTEMQKKRITNRERMEKERSGKKYENNEKESKENRRKESTSQSCQI